MATTFGLRGSNSAALQQTGGNEVVANAALIATQPAGQLLTFLSTVFANDAAAETAFAAAAKALYAAASKGVVHKSNAARRVGRLAAAVSALKA